MPDLDPRTWAILGLASLLLLIVICVPAVRTWVAGMLVALGAAMGARKRARRRPDQTTPEQSEPEPVTVADDADRETAEAVEQEEYPTDEELREDFQEIADGE